MKCWQLAYVYRYMFLRVRVYVNKYFIFNTIIYVVYFHISVTFHTASSSTQKKCHLVRWNGFKNVIKCGNVVSYWSKITGRGNVTVMSFLINCAAYMMRHLRIYFISTGNFFWGTAFKQSEILFKSIKFVYWLQSDLFNFWICFIKSELFYYYATSCVMTNRNAFLIEIFILFEIFVFFHNFNRLRTLPYLKCSMYYCTSLWLLQVDFFKFQLNLKK